MKSNSGTNWSVFLEPDSPDDYIVANINEKLSPHIPICTYTVINVR